MATWPRWLATWCMGRVKLHRSTRAALEEYSRHVAAAMVARNEQRRIAVGRNHLGAAVKAQPHDVGVALLACDVQRCPAVRTRLHGSTVEEKLYHVVVPRPGCFVEWCAPYVVSPSKVGAAAKEQLQHVKATKGARDVQRSPSLAGRPVDVGAAV